MDLSFLPNSIPSSTRLSKAASKKMTRLPQILVVGGNGFLGSAICKEALSRGWKVVSISQSGKPFVSPAGHRPSWSSSQSITWKQGNAMDPSTYHDFLESSDAVVHTLGILLEGDYKGKSRESSSPALSGIKALVQGWREESGWKDKGNPLERKSERTGKYETVNRDSALTVAQSFISSEPNFSTPFKQSPFVYISAEDIFRPIIPSRYIETKREAEMQILELAAKAHFQSRSHERETEMANPQKGQEVLLDADGAGLEREIESESRQSGASLEKGRGGGLRRIRPVFIRPGIMYHPHTRPLSTIPAALFDLTSTLQSKHVKSNLPFPTISSILSRISSNLDPLSRLLSISPLHVDTVAKAVCESIRNQNVRGPVDTVGIKRLSGWKFEGDEARHGKEGTTGGV